MSDAPRGAPDVTVIIVSWNVRDLVGDCIRSVIDQTRHPHEIIVVDNASADGTAAMVAAEFPDVTLVANDDNRGFAAANNQALLGATGRHVLLLNPDTLVLDGAIDVMVDWLDEHPDVGCAGCQVLETETDIQMTCFRDPNPLNMLLIETGLHRMFSGSRWFGRPAYGGWDRTDQRDVDVVSGMFMLVPRHVVDEVGPMDDAFFIYSEEADWCRRIRNAGYRCVFVPLARILHREGGGKSTAQTKPKMYVQLQKSKLIYIDKHYGILGRVSAKVIMTGSMLTRGVVFGLMSLFNRQGDSAALARLAWTATRFHLTGREPT